MKPLNYTQTFSAFVRSLVLQCRNGKHHFKLLFQFVYRGIIRRHCRLSGGSWCALLVLSAVILPSQAQAVWFDSNWDYRVSVEIAPSKVGTTTAVTNFPVYLDLAGLPAAFWSNVKGDGGDIRVVEGDETTETAFELVSISTTSSAGELHFLADSLSTTSTSTFYVYYGNPSASTYAVTDTYGRNNVWTGYRAVYHFDDLLADSTGNGYTLTNLNTVATGTGTVGSVAADFGATNTSRALRYTTNDMGIAGADPFSITSYVKLHQDVNGTQTFYGLHYKNIFTASGALVLTAYQWNSGSPLYYTNNFRATTSNQTYSHTWGTSDWKQSAYTYTGSRWDSYLNGVSVMGANQSGTANYSGTTGFGIGEYGVGGGGYLRGLVDEVRLYDGALTQAQVITEYNNIISPTTFYTIGTEESDGAAATTTPASVISGSGLISGGGTIMR